ncbi:MAG TPA: hypothetical protein VG796_09025 [Verrucomicrobiales bacterium]|nr:hypothetical protein [Verrucomicrobiales bacterium]
MNCPLTRRTAIAAGIGAVCGVPLTRAADETGRPSNAVETNNDSPAEILKKAEMVYEKARTVAQTDYRKALARAIQGADKVQACLLDFEASIEGDWREVAWDDNDWFVIPPLPGKTKILKRVDLKPPQSTGAVKFMASLVREDNPGGGAGCHFPIHGLRFFKGDSLFYFTSLCWICENFSVSYPDDLAGLPAGHWLGLRQGGKDLEALMKSVLPVPDEVARRFSEKYPSKIK